MDPDVLKTRWAEQDRRLDASIRLNHRLLTATNMDRVRSPVRNFALLSGLAAATGLISLLITGTFIYTHRSEPRFAVPAAILHAWIVAFVAVSVRQALAAWDIDFDKPVATIQKELASLRLMRLRATQWALLTGQVVWWIPLLIVTLRGVWNVDAYHALGSGFLTANAAIGLAFIPFAIWMSKRFGERMRRFPAARWLTDEVAGRNIGAATAFLAALAAFETESSE